MKIIAFNGSPKKNGNTYQALKMVTDELEKEGIEVEIIHVGNQKMNGCLACGHCFKGTDKKCAIVGDHVNEWIEKMDEADGVLIGSPVYFAGINGAMKCFLDRAFLVAGLNGLMRHKVGASVVAVRRTGGMTTFNQLNQYLNYGEMILPASNYWNVIHGMAPGDVQQDEEGVQIMQTLGKNMAYTLKTMKQSTIEAPASVQKIMTNFNAGSTELSPIDS